VLLGGRIETPQPVTLFTACGIGLNPWSCFHQEHLCFSEDRTLTLRTSALARSSTKHTSQTFRVIQPIQLFASGNWVARSSWLKPLRK
jgi:hypothetical protein